MRVTYDKEADALAILLSDEEMQETRSIAEGVEVDFDSKGRVLAIEILGASKKYDLSGTVFDVPGPYYSLASAGEKYGLSPDTLRHQIHRGLLRGFKIGRNWLVRDEDLESYVSRHSRKPKPFLVS